MQKHWCVWVAVAGLGMAAACTKQVNVCHQDGDCKDVAYPFCDVNGEYAASGGDKGVCTIVPPDCPAGRCGCTPGAITCASNILSVCNTDQTSTTDSTCGLGCATDRTHCLKFNPSNGLADALAAAAAEGDVEIPDGDSIYSDGRVWSDLSDPTSVKSVLLAQSNGLGLRVFLAKSFKIHRAFLNGSDNAIALLASDSIEIDGAVAVAPRGTAPGTALPMGACWGQPGSFGGGGGGNATSGGNGAKTASLPPQPGAPGGAAQVDSFEPLGGGCPGGTELSNGGSTYGGRGGLALQLVAGHIVTVTASGSINSGGGGGGGDGGAGGAGGNVLIEAPQVRIDGILAANGGSGGACGIAGVDGTADATPAVGVGGCNTQNFRYSGAGGTGNSPPTDGVHADLGGAGAGGGGAAGRVGIHTLDGQYSHGAGATLSAKVSTAKLMLE